MPIYEYRCRNGHNFEVLQSMTHDPVTECEVCGAPVERVFHPVAIHFKGSGFYSTDYGRNRGGGGGLRLRLGLRLQGQIEDRRTASSKSESSSSDSSSGSSGGDKKSD